MIFILYGCGIDYTHLLAPTPDAPTMAAKFSTIGISEDLVRSGVSVLVGMLKIMVAVNNYVLDSAAMSMFLFLVSAPSFALVAYSHVELGLPMADNVPCVVMPALLGIIAFTSSAGQQEEVQEEAVHMHQRGQWTLLAKVILGEVE